MLSQTESGAGNETRTRDLYLGKVSLYQLSYSRKKRSPHYMDIELHVKKICLVIFVLFESRPPLYNAPLMNFGTGVSIQPLSPGGEIGRHNGLKIRRNRKKCVPVRFRSRAPNPIDMPVSTGFPGFRHKWWRYSRLSRHAASGKFVGQKATSLLPTNPIYITIRAGTSTIT